MLNLPTSLRLLKKGVSEATENSINVEHMVIYAMHVYCMFLMEFPVLDLALDHSGSDISIHFMISACSLALWEGFKEQCTRTPY